jgi:hypothetical protein
MNLLCKVCSLWGSIAIAEPVVQRFRVLFIPPLPCAPVTEVAFAAHTLSKGPKEARDESQKWLDEVAMYLLIKACCLGEEMATRRTISEAERATLFMNGIGCLMREDGQ